MTTTEAKLILTREELTQLIRDRAELAAELAPIKEALDHIDGRLKEHMLAAAEDEITTAGVHITYREVRSSRFDSAALKKIDPTLYSLYTREQVARRFVFKALDD